MKILLTLLFCLVTTLVFADVTGEIIAIDRDENSIRVWSQYKIDGVEVESRYPKINGKSVFCVRYHALLFVGMTDEQIKERILKDVDEYTKALIRKAYLEKANEELILNHTKGVVGSAKNNTYVILQIDTDNDKIADKEITIKTDGTKIEKNISP